MYHFLFFCIVYHNFFNIIIAKICMCEFPSKVRIVEQYLSKRIVEQYTTNFMEDSRI